MTDQGIRMKNPPHVGGFLKSEIIEGHSLSVTADMALRFEKAFGLSMDTLMRMQNSYDIAQARQRADQIDVAPYVPKTKPEPQPSVR